VANLHAVAASAVAVVNATETIIASMTPFGEYESIGGGDFTINPVVPQGILLEGTVNITVGTSGVAVVLRVRNGGLTGALVGVAQTTTVVAASLYTISIVELDPTLIQAQALYVLTAQVTSGAANSTANRVVFAAQAATSAT
jgi:hypothetical protein